MDLNKLKINNIKELEIKECEVEIDKIVISDNWIIIQGKEFNYYLDTEYDLCSLDWKIEDDFGEGHIKHKNKSIKSKEQWNKELIELRKIQRTYEDTMGQLMIWKGDIFTIEVENRKVKSLVDFIKEKLQQL